MPRTCPSAPTTQMPAVAIVSQIRLAAVIRSPSSWRIGTLPDIPWFKPGACMGHAVAMTACRLSVLSFTALLERVLKPESAVFGNALGIGKRTEIDDLAAIDGGARGSFDALAIDRVGNAANHVNPCRNMARRNF